MIEATEEEAFLAYILITITSPLCGASISGHVANAVGGYKSKIIIPVCMFLMSICCLLSLPIPLFNNFKLICTMLWLFFFFATI